MVDNVDDKGNEKTEKTDVVETVESAQAVIEKGKRRMVSKIMDQEVIKCVLLCIHESPGEKIIQADLKKKIIDLGINCSDVQAIKFLRKGGYIKEEVVSRIKIFISLSEKGLKLLGHKIESAENVGHLPASAGLLSGQQPINKQADQPSELTLLAAKFEQLKKDTIPLAEKVKNLEKQFSAAKLELFSVETEMDGVKQKIQDLLK